MNKEELFEVIAEIEEKHVKTAREPATGKKVPIWVKWGALAACVCVCVLGVIIRLQASNRPAEVDLPMLTISLGWGEMGYEGYLYYDISEWNSGNPWEETAYDALPVFKNGAYNAIGIPVGLDKETMRANAEAVAKVLDMDILELREKTVGETIEGSGLTADAVTRVEAVTSEAVIRAEADGTVTIDFGEGRKLPEEFNMTHHDTTDREATAVLDHLLEEYSALLELEQPEKVLFWERNIYGQMIRHYSVYEAVGDAREDLLNYHFNYVQFSPDDDGELMLIRLYDGLACAERIGDYPIISQEEALTLLLNGNYATSVPYEIAGEERVAGVELVYRSGSGEQIFLPYYRFFVELPETLRNDELKDYGAYYVPAVEGRYIENMPTYDGHFN